jgi:hypothetical protein
MLINDPTVEVLGITTVSGDGWQAEETAATLRARAGGADGYPGDRRSHLSLINSKERNRRREALYGAVPYKARGWMNGPPITPSPGANPTPPTSSPPWPKAVPRQNPFP